MSSFTQVGVEAVVKGKNKFLSDLGGMGKGIANFGLQAAKYAVAGIGVFGAAVAGVGAISVKSAVSFESAWAGVVKTTDGLTDSLGNLTEEGAEVQQGFRDLSKEIPTTIEELLAIGEIGGQLGIARDDLVGFTETIAAMGEATNLTREEAATDMAKIANIMQTTSRTGVEGFSQMGSSIVALGNNFATTERDILAFATRIAGAGQVAGLTEADLFAIGAAMSSVGVEAEAGGTAVQKVLLGINEAVITQNESLGVFAATAGMSATAFADVWQDQPIEALQAFVNGLGAAGDDALTILDSLDLKDQRLVRSFLSLAGAGDLLNRTVDLSNEAFGENTALQAEAAARYRTTASQWGIFKNVIKDVFITIGSALLPVLNELLAMARPLIDEFAKNLPGWINGFLLPTIRTLVDWLKDNLPAAIATAAEFWTNTLQPVLATVWQFLTDSLIPAIMSIISFFQNDVGTAVETGSSFFTGTLIPALQKVWEWISDNVIPIFQELVAFWADTLKPIAEDATAFVKSTWEGLVSWFQSVIPLINQTVQTVFSAISNFIDAHGAQIQGIITAVWTNIKNIITFAVEIVKNIIELVMNIINGNWEAAWENVQSILAAAWDFIKQTVQVALLYLANFIPIMLDVIKSIWSAAWEFIKTGLENAWEAIKGAVEQGTRLVKILISIAMEKAQEIITNVWNGIQDFFSTLWNDTLPNLFRTGVDTLKNIVLGLADKMVEAGKAIVDNLKQGIENAWQGLKDWFGSKLQELKDKLPWSEPVDKTSPLSNLSESGSAAVKNFMEGIKSAMPMLQAQFDAAFTPNTLTPAPMLAPAASGPTYNNTSVIVNPTLAGNPTTQSMYYDVVSALEVARR